MKSIILKNVGDEVTGQLIGVAIDDRAPFTTRSMTILVDNEVCQLYVPDSEIPALVSLINTGVYKIKITGTVPTIDGRKRKLISVTSK